MSSSSIAGAASSEGPALVRRPRAIVASVRTVVKRDGTSEPVRFDAIYDEIRRCADMAEPPLHERVDTSIVAQKTIAGLFNGITTEELSELASEDAAALTSLHHDYSRLAAILANVNHQKKVKPTFSQAMTDLFDYTDIKTGKDASMLDPTVYAFIMEHAETLDAAVQPVRDMLIDYFGFKVGNTP
jgi:ribonucleoside-diphosphate reductase alpha chain